MTAARWDYRAFDPDGTDHRGSVNADSEAEAAQIVRTLGLRPTRLDRVRESVFRREFSLPSFGGSVRPEDLASATRQLSTMLGSGVSLRRSLSVLQTQTGSGRLADALADVANSVESGESLSGAFGENPKVFGTVMVALVRAGESSGALETVLDQAADQLERQAELRRKVRATLAYPLSVLVLVTLVLVAMSIFVVPVFRGVYADLGHELPIITRIVLGITGFIGSNILYLAAATAASIWASRRYRSTPSGRRRVDTWLLRAPGLGPLIRQAALARAARTMSVLANSGVPLLAGLNITAATVGNEALADVFIESGNAVEAGRPLSEALVRSSQIPPLFGQMIAVGEESGDLSEMLRAVADVYDDGVDAVAASFSAVMEPVMIAGLGAVVGGLVLSLYLPMFRLVDIVQ